MSELSRGPGDVWVRVVSKGVQSEITVKRIDKELTAVLRYQVVRVTRSDDEGVARKQRLLEVGSHLSEQQILIAALELLEEN